MARLTVEDCLQHVDNRFELILQASKRAREIIRGGDPLVPWDNDQATVVALREIADGLHLEDIKKKSAAPAVMAVESEEAIKASAGIDSAESDENADSSAATAAEQTSGDGEDAQKSEEDGSEEDKGERE